MPAFGRLPQFDERSRHYPIRRAALPKKPRKRTWQCRTVLDQGADGACVGFAFAHDVIAAPFHTFRTWGYDEAVGLYHEAQRADPWPGGAYPGATPFYEGTSVLAGAQVLHRFGHIDQYRWAFNVDDLALAVGHDGPAVIGVDWREGMLTPDSDGYVFPTGRPVGGHAVLVRAVWPNRERFTIRNSWGRGWGRNGDAYITYRGMEHLLADDGEACIPLARSRGTRLT